MAVSPWPGKCLTVVNIPASCAPLTASATLDVTMLLTSSAVSGLAESKGAAVALTQMLRVPLNGLMKAINLPSGDICAPAISGSPN